LWLARMPIMKTRQNLKRVSKVSVTVFLYACITITSPCEFLG
jgi:hypothetical protein